MKKFIPIVIIITSILSVIYCRQADELSDNQLSIII